MMMASLRVSSLPTTRLILALCTACSLTALSSLAQTSSSSSNSEIRQQTQAPSSSSAARARRAEAAGAAVTLETNEALFTVATGLNACGYDDDLADSNPVRAEIRADVEAAVQASPAALKSQRALCNYMSEHELSDHGRQVAQYVSLGLYLSPPPALTTTADQLDMPPDALQVVNVLPLLRTFSEDVGLHSIWLKHRPEYDALTARVHDPLTRIILDANIYVRVPVSTYDGRTFQVLVEPMLAPSAPNARIYATDYDIVTSPDLSGKIRMEQVRHLYLHYVIEPLVYSSAASMQRLTPLLKPVQAAPLDFIYKSDIVALLTECLIKSIEARTMDVGLTPPVKPRNRNIRAEQVQYDAALAVYERQAEQVRRRQVDLDMRQGWVLTDYFYGQMAQREHDSASLKEEMGEMVYGMDVGREQHHDEQIAFLPEGSGEFVRRVRPQPTGIMLAEELMMKGDLDGARSLAEKALADPKQDHAEAEFVVARVDLMEGDPETSQAGLKNVLATAKNPRTLAWAHIYMGRLLDTKTPPERTQAIAEYKAAANVPGIQPDARAAAQAGIQTAFIVPRTAHTEEEPVDPTGKAEKEAYRPDTPEPPAKPQ